MSDAVDPYGGPPPPPPLPDDKEKGLGSSITSDALKSAIYKKLFEAISHDLSKIMRASKEDANKITEAALGEDPNNPPS